MSTTESGEEYHTCSHRSQYMVILGVIFVVVWCVGTRASYLSRKVPDRWSDSHPTANAIYTTCIIALCTIPIYVFLDKQQETLLRVILVSIVFVLCLIPMYFRKVWYMGFKTLEEFQKKNPDRVKRVQMFKVGPEFYRTTSDEEEHRSTKFSLARNITKGKDNDGWEAIQKLSIGVDEIDSCFPGESQEYRDVVRDLMVKKGCKILAPMREDSRSFTNPASLTSAVKERQRSERASVSLATAGKISLMRSSLISSSNVDIPFSETFTDPSLPSDTPTVLDSIEPINSGSVNEIDIGDVENNLV